MQKIKNKLNSLFKVKIKIIGAINIDNFGFTLIELIVVITILAILGTIAFMSLQGFSKGARDSARISDLKNIEQGLEIILTKDLKLPIPEDFVEITASGKVIGYQGYVGQKVKGEASVFGELMDPLDYTYYTYSVDINLKKYELLGFLEQSDKIALNSDVLKQLKAIDYSNRFPIIKGNPLGIIVDTITKEPIQTTGTGIDIVNTNDEYSVFLSKNENITGTGLVLKLLQPNASCKRIKDLNLNSNDGIYKINPTGKSEFEVYCDMTTDGGGWTYATMLADTSVRNLFHTNNTNKITSLKTNISSKGQLEDIWRDNNNKDIMLKCYTVSPTGYNIPFIMYDFEKTDIGNLIRQNKKNCTDSADPLCRKFSSKKIKAKWNGLNYDLSQTYLGSSFNESFQLKIRDGEPRDLVWSNIAGIRIGIRSVETSSVYDYSPATNTYGDGGGELSTNNYCVTAIR